MLQTIIAFVTQGLDAVIVAGHAPQTALIVTSTSSTSGAICARSSAK